MDGKSLSRHNIESLDVAARELGVRPLSEFFSIAPEQAAEFMEGEGVDTGDIELPPLRQFSAVEGLTTVNLDFVRLYRPQTNVVSRPVAGFGKGYSLVGHHEIMIPLLAAALIDT